MTTVALNNLWSYIQGMSLKKKDREWLAGKLLEPVDDAKTAQQKAFVKESLTLCMSEHSIADIHKVNPYRRQLCTNETKVKFFSL
jgi:hypothetical protein